MAGRLPHSGLLLLSSVFPVSGTPQRIAQISVQWIEKSNDQSQRRSGALPIATTCQKQRFHRIVYPRWILRRQ